MKSLVLMLSIISLCIGGCAGQNTAAGNVATGATINAVAGVPGAGIVTLVATAAEIFSKIGQPKIGKTSPDIRHHLMKTPGYVKDASGKVIWVPRKQADGTVITADNAPQRSMECTETYVRAVSSYLQGIFGDTTEMQRANLAAWKDGKTVIAEYHGPNNSDIVIVSTNREPATVMLSEEWKKNTGSAPKVTDDENIKKDM